jgi:REP element-mobilizing transposase RayT
MPRRPRADLEPGVHHVFARGNNRGSIFGHDDDRRAYLRRLAQVVTARRWSCLAYCLMGNHVHLLIETKTPDLADGMRAIHGPYAQAYNRRYSRTGHLFENRFGSVRVEDDAQLWMVLGYIGRNPVAAGLCRRPGDWPWSSYGAVAAGTPAPWLDVPRLWELVGASGGVPLLRYVECVEPERPVPQCEPTRPRNVNRPVPAM